MARRSTTHDTFVVREPSEIAAAREAVVERLIGCVGDGRSDDVALVTSELVTNALEHGDPPVEVILDVIDGDAFVRVSSISPDSPRPSSSMPSPDEARGRGLHIVRAVSDDVRMDESDGRVVVVARFACR